MVLRKWSEFEPRVDCDDPEAGFELRLDHVEQSRFANAVGPAKADAAWHVDSKIDIAEERWIVGISIFKNVIYKDTNSVRSGFIFLVPPLKFRKNSIGV